MDKLKHKKAVAITSNEWEKELAKFEQTRCGVKLVFTPEQDEQILWVYNNKKVLKEFATWFYNKYHFGCTDTLRNRLRYLLQHRNSK